jgi:hypothetical protein
MHEGVRQEERQVRQAKSKEEVAHKEEVAQGQAIRRTGQEEG